MTSYMAEFPILKTIYSLSCFKGLSLFSADSLSQEPLVLAMSSKKNLSLIRFILQWRLLM